MAGFRSSARRPKISHSLPLANAVPLDPSISRRQHAILELCPVRYQLRPAEVRTRCAEVLASSIRLSGAHTAKTTKQKTTKQNLRRHEQNWALNAILLECDQKPGSKHPVRPKPAETGDQVASLPPPPPFAPPLPGPTRGLATRAPPRPAAAPPLRRSSPPAAPRPALRSPSRGTPG